MPLKLSAWLPAPLVEFDDGETVHTLSFEVRQLTLGEEKFSVAKDFDRWMNPPSRALVARRHDRPDEVAREPLPDGTDGPFVIDEAAIIERRRAEMTVEARARYDAMLDAEDVERSEGVRRAVKAHIRMARPGQVSYTTDEGEEVDVVTGEDILRAFAHQERFLAVLWGILYNENFLNDRKKRVLRSPSPSTPSSPAPSRGPVGQKPAQTANNVGHEGAVSAADAMAGTGQRSSGVAVQ